MRYTPATIRKLNTVTCLSLLILFVQADHLTAGERFVDSHIHFNWDQRPETSIDEVIAILKEHNAGLTIVADTQSTLALEPREKGGDWVIPFFSPYSHELGKRDWYLDAQVVKQAKDGLRNCLRNDLYYGIGEVLL